MFIKRAFALTFLILMVFINTSCSIYTAQNNSTVSIVESGSWFNDYTVSDGKVYINCEITLQNTGESEQRIRMAAICADDVEAGLLKKEKIYAVDNNEEEKVFVIEANSQRTFKEVVFLGEYGGTYQKSNKLLPEIVFEKVN